MRDDTTTITTEAGSGADESGEKVVEDLIAGVPTATVGATYLELLDELHQKGLCLALTTDHELVKAIAAAGPALAKAGITLSRFKRNGTHRLRFTQREPIAH